MKNLVFPFIPGYIPNLGSPNVMKSSNPFNDPSMLELRVRFAYAMEDPGVTKSFGSHASGVVMSNGSKVSLSSAVGNLCGNVMRHESMFKCHKVSPFGSLKDCVPLLPLGYVWVVGLESTVQPASASWNSDRRVSSALGCVLLHGYGVRTFLLVDVLGLSPRCRFSDFSS